MGDPTYSVTMAHYEMAGTVERSVRSVVDQLGPEYEVVVVDGGSTDGSRELLADLAAAHDALRVLDGPPSNSLGADRQFAVEAARGEYVLTQLDADDEYAPCIDSFVALYHAIESARDRPFYLSGKGINMAPRSLLASIGYRDLPVAEDRDLWRRLFAADALVWLNHEPFHRELRPARGLREQVRRDLAVKVAEARTGVTLRSGLRWALTTGKPYFLEERRSGLSRATKAAYDVGSLLLAHALARGEPRLPLPERFRRRGALEEAIVDALRTVDELAAEYDLPDLAAAVAPDCREYLCAPRIE